MNELIHSEFHKTHQAQLRNSTFVPLQQKEFPENEYNFNDLIIGDRIFFFL